jgi:hypothetical protein
MPNSLCHWIFLTMRTSKLEDHDGKSRMIKIVI